MTLFGMMVGYANGTVSKLEPVIHNSHGTPNLNDVAILWNIIESRTQSPTRDGSCDRQGGSISPSTPPPRNRSFSPPPPPPKGGGHGYGKVLVNHVNIHSMSGEVLETINTSGHVSTSKSFAAACLHSQQSLTLKIKLVDNNGKLLSANEHVSTNDILMILVEEDTGGEKIYE